MAGAAGGGGVTGADLIAVDLSGLALPELAKLANDAADRAEAGWSEALAAAVECGEVLLAARGQLGRGEWGEWLAGNFNRSARHARNFMKLARERDRLTGENGNALPLRRALALLAEGRPEAVDLDGPEHDFAGLFARAAELEPFTGPLVPPEGCGLLAEAAGREWWLVVMPSAGQTYSAAFMEPLTAEQRAYYRRMEATTFYHVALWRWPRAGMSDEEHDAADVTASGTRRPVSAEMVGAYVAEWLSVEDVRGGCLRTIATDPPRLAWNFYLWPTQEDQTREDRERWEARGRAGVGS